MELIESGKLRGVVVIVRPGVLPTEIERLMRTPGVHHVTVYHDSWCSIFRGRACDCDPDIRVHQG